MSVSSLKNWQKLEILSKVAWNFQKKIVQSSHKNYVKFTLKLCEILLKIESNSLENCVKFFKNWMKFS